MRYGKKLIPVLAVVLMVLLSWYAGSIFTPQQIRNVLDGLGFWAPAAYIGLFTLLPAFFFPVAVLALAGGLLFGLWKGALYTFIGAMLNCTLMFLTARHIGREQIQSLIRRKLNPVWQQRLERIGGREGFVLLIVLRLIPAVPYNLINYAFGLTPMPFGAYLLASAVGIIPGTFAFINIGDKVTEAGSADFWIAIGLLALLLAVTGLLGKIIYKEKET